MLLTAVLCRFEKYGPQFVPDTQVLHFRYWLAIGPLVDRSSADFQRLGQGQGCAEKVNRLFFGKSVRLHVVSISTLTRRVQVP